MKDSIALVTGAATGIGEAVSRQLTKARARVAVCDVDETAGAALAEELGSEFILCDVSDFTSINNAVATCVESLGVPAFAHLNAGVMTVGSDDEYLAIEDVPLENYRRIMGVNFGGVFHGLKALLPIMRENGGAITVTASIAGFPPIPIDPLYGATKAALISLVRSIAAANEGSNIRINAVCPGVVDTAIVPGAMRGNTEMMPASTLAAEIVDLLNNGVNGEIRVKLAQDKPAFAVAPVDLSSF
ncbi:MAG: SDR family oxidoreductase [Pseudomonadales bacterium]|jgi:NAD(P)-dependent dehydrogenase (short-subunit alcohol dehydrogenase family)|nr:SDR family oxidoreductase [Pseudomonadales bacterium]|tara:strand:+ start:2920 stop:3651 length:732 start_codon:yes stop_codon:yes gene_type:complete